MEKEPEISSTSQLDIVPEISAQKPSNPQENPNPPDITYVQPHSSIGFEKSVKTIDNEVLEPPSGTVENAQSNAVSDVPYSVFTASQKKMIVLTGSMASLFSPMSTSIYYPSLSQIAKDLHVSDAKISLTVTLFLVCGIRSSLFICSILISL